MRVDLKLFDSQLGAKEVHSVLTEGGGSMGTYNLVNDYTLTLQNGRNKAADKIIHEKTTGGNKSLRIRGVSA